MGVNESEALLLYASLLQNDGQTGEYILKGILVYLRETRNNMSIISERIK